MVLYVQLIMSRCLVELAMIGIRPCDRSPPRPRMLRKERAVRKLFLSFGLPSETNTQTLSTRALHER